MFLQSRPIYRTAAGVVGLAATLLLHSLFIVVAMWGDGVLSRFPDRPDAIGAGANHGNPEGTSLERRITVQILSEISPSHTPAPMDAFLEDALRSPAKIDITGPDAISLPPLIVADDGKAAESTDAELIAREMMVGIYQSQIRARIERAWELPGKLLPAESFTCRALIRQHRDGRVSEVELPYETCDGTPAMRHSLINAIFTASPLPAPPHPGVFIDSFSFMFRAEYLRSR